MLISILIPTRNRCELLSQCIYTILEQEDSNFEIIISDNFSDDNTFSVVSKINDKRIKYFRQQCLVSVTENWNYALSKASGEYHLMLGDDDGLSPIFFENIRKLIKKYNNPELIRFSGYNFIFPGALKLSEHSDKARLRNYRQPEIIEREGELVLSDILKKNMVTHSLNFKHRFEFNMQFSVVSKSLQKRMESFGNFYQSPYPDFYASNALLLEAKTNVWSNNKLVIVGLSTKSFGHYYFNGNEKEGVKFLGNKIGNWAGEYLVNILPGPDNNTFWYLAMEAIRSSLPKHHNLIVNIARYRFLQTGYFLRHAIITKKINFNNIFSFLNKLTFKECIIYGYPLFISFFIIKLFPINLIFAILGIFRKFSYQYGTPFNSTEITLPLSGTKELYQYLKIKN